MKLRRTQGHLFERKGWREGVQPQLSGALGAVALSVLQLRLPLYTKICKHSLLWLLPHWGPGLCLSFKWPWRQPGTGRGEPLAGIAGHPDPGEAAGAWDLWKFNKQLPNWCLCQFFIVPFTGFAESCMLWREHNKYPKTH